jgi:hypothetical protein
MAIEIDSGEISRNGKIYTWRFYENEEVKIFHTLEYQYSIKYSGRKKLELLEAIRQAIDKGKPPKRTVNSNYNQDFYPE